MAGQVPTRLWGSDHIFQSMWPNNLSCTLPFPIPADVSHVMGWNQLPIGSFINKQKPTMVPRERRAKNQELDPALQSIQSEFEICP